ncbi:MAG: hypothetical protein VXW65_14120 [Pseudomonadota bacterium]|nr:hypothetical protein [Pseudomonadota bacterium]
MQRFDVATKQAAINRRVVLRHPSSFGVVVFRPQSERVADGSVGDVPNLGRVGVIGVMDEADLVYTELGGAKLLRVNADQNPLGNLRGFSPIAETFDAKIEPLAEPCSTDWFVPQPQDLVTIFLDPLQQTYQAYSIVDPRSETFTAGAARWTATYTLEARDDISQIDPTEILAAWQSFHQRCRA